SSIGLPTILVSRAARPGCSSKATALRNAARSPSLMPAKSNTACALHQPASPPFTAGLWGGGGGVRPDAPFSRFVMAEGKQPRGRGQGIRTNRVVAEAVIGAARVASDSPHTLNSRLGFEFRRVSDIRLLFDAKADGEAAPSMRAGTRQPWSRQPMRRAL